MGFLTNPFARFKAGSPSDQDERSDNPEKMQREVGVEVNDLISTRIQGKFESYNPDKLVQRKGLKVYRNMLRDDQVKAAFSLKSHIIISRKMTFTVTDESQRECAEFFERNITDLLCGTWKRAMRGILMGKAYGYSMSEKVFRSALVDDKPRWVLDKLKLKPPESFNFKTDKYGNIVEITQQQGMKDVRINPDKFVHYVNAPEFDDIWGESDLKAAYKAYWEKDVVGKFWSIYLERAASGFIAAIPGENAPNLGDPEKTQLEKVLRNISGFSGIRVPEGYDIKVEIPGSNDAFEKAIDKKDKQIARAILVPNFLGFSEQGKYGTYSQSETALDMFMMIIEEEADYLADLLNESVFAQLAYWNFGITDYPRAKFTPYTTEQKRAIAEMWIKAVKEKAVTPMLEDELYTRSLMLYPVPDKEELEEVKKERAAAALAIGAGKDNNDKTVDTDKKDKPSGKADDKTEDKDKSDTPSDSEAGKETKQSDSTPSASVSPVTINVTGSLSNMSADNQDNPDIPADKSKMSKQSADNQDNPDHLENIDYEQPMFTDRMDFTAAAERLDSIEDDWWTDLAAGVDNALESLQDEISKQYKTQGDSKEVDTEALQNAFSSSIKKAKSKINKTSQDHLKQGYNYGRRLAKKAIDIALQSAPDDVKKKIKIKMSCTSLSACMDKEWTVLHFVEGLSTDTADAWFSSTAFDITGSLSQDMTDAAVQVFKNGIMNDWSSDQIRNELADVLSPLVGKRDPDTGKLDKAERARLNTIVRTNMSTIFTQAQLAFYADPDLNGFVEGLEYSAVMDRRTTPTCMRLDGAKYAIDNPIWRYITPPNHFQCRSVLLPATVLDNWKQSTRTYTKKQIPAKGFGQAGFPDKYLSE